MKGILRARYNERYFIFIRGGMIQCIFKTVPHQRIPITVSGKKMKDIFFTG